jgi:hypothetical protein
MIYRHYKGGLYYNVGFATRFSNEFPAHSIEQVAMARYTEANTPEEEQQIAVLIVHDKSTGSTYYAYQSNVVDGIMTFYKDLDGNHWLRPMEMFYGYLEDGTKRFVKVKGEELFNILSEEEFKIKFDKSYIL